MNTRSVKSTVHAWDERAVAAFEQGSDEILVVARPQLSGLDEAVGAIGVCGYRGVATSDNARMLVSEALNAIQVNHPALADDMVGLVQSFLAQFDCEQVNVRVDVVEKQLCPKFHCDNVRIRLVATYLGPATQYIHRDSPEAIQSAPTPALVFLKGHQHPRYTDGIHHRSPEVPPGRRRFCLVLDV